MKPKTMRAIMGRLDEAETRYKKLRRDLTAMSAVMIACMMLFALILGRLLVNP